MTDYSDTLTYQWDEKEYEWRKISGADSSECRTGEMETENLYRCLVSDGYNQGLAYRTVKVDRGFVVKKGEEYVYADANATAVLSVDASTREGTLTYQWYEYDEEKIEGATSAQLILKNVTEDYSSYYCIVSNGYEEEKVYRTVRTAGRVNEEDVITVGGGGTRYILPGENVKLYVIVPTDKKYVSYKWYKSSWADEDVELIGVERSVTVDQEGEYYCDVTHR